MLIDLNPVRVFYAEIIAQAGETKRESERRCVAELVREAFGADARLTHDASGRPLVDGASISVSHSRTYAALAVAPPDISVGIDVEDNSERVSRVIGRVLRGAFAKLYATPSRALMGWTLLEAAFKCIRVNDGFTLVDFHLPDPTSSPEGRNITFTGEPKELLNILACRRLADDTWMSLVISD